MSESGLDLLNALAEPKTLEELVSVLTAKYEVTLAQATDSAREFLEHGVRTGVLMVEEVR